MPYVALVLISLFFSLFLWLLIRALRTKVTGGIGWSVAQAKQPVLYWLCVGAWLLNAAVGLAFFCLVARS